MFSEKFYQTSSGFPRFKSATFLHVNLHVDLNADFLHSIEMGLVLKIASRDKGPPYFH